MRRAPVRRTSAPLAAARSTSSGRQVASLRAFWSLAALAVTASLGCVQPALTNRAGRSAPGASGGFDFVARWERGRCAPTALSCRITPPTVAAADMFPADAHADVARVVPDSADSTTDSADAPVSAAPVRQLKVLTFNLWTVELPVPRFVYQVSRDIDSRLRLLPQKVLETGADILIFQEVWRDARKRDLIERFRQLGYRYSIRSKDDGGAFERGAIGNGLLIISRYPLSPERDLLRFSKYTRGYEYFARKGAIKTSVSIPGLGWIDLVDAHMGAVATEKANGRPDHFNGHDLSVLADQVRELVRFISRSASSGIVLAAMDMNAHYQVLEHGSYQASFAPEYTMLTCAGLGVVTRVVSTDCLGLKDTFRAVHGFESTPSWTYDTHSNRYAGDGMFAVEPPGVLDYIFVNENPKLVPVSSEIVFKERPADADGRTIGLGPRMRVPEHLSDHYGVLTTFAIRN
ncbi:MAG: endonuclease/exonuclease/phosphatase family protein [Gemmatimonadales bacterium]